MTKAWKVVDDIISQMTEQLQDSGPENFIATNNDDGATWAVARPYSETEIVENDQNRGSKLRRFFKMNSDKYIQKGLSVSIQHYKEDNETHLWVQTTHSDKSESMTINLRWYDHLRPVMFRVRKLIRLVHAEIIDKHSLDLDKQLAEICPSRIDNILLGDDKKQ